MSLESFQKEQSSSHFPNKYVKEVIKLKKKKKEVIKYVKKDMCKKIFIIDFTVGL